MYKLIKEVDNNRTYRSEITGTEIEMFVLKTTPETGEKWWAFRDLLSMPFIRKKASEKLTDLYGASITKDDIDRFVSSMKELLKSTNPEKYERAYSEILQLESLAARTADPIKQSLSLCAVYILSDIERPDTFSNKETIEKMEHWALQPELQAFFLIWLSDGMNDFTKHYSNIMAIASTLQK